MAAVGFTLATPANQAHTKPTPERRATMFRTRRPWVAHTLGIAAAALIWAVTAHFWGDNYTWWIMPAIFTWPTYRWTKNLLLLGMPDKPPRAGEYIPYDPYHPNTTGYFNYGNRD